MTQFPLTYISVAANTKVVVQKFRYKYKGYAIEGGDIGDFIIINSYLPKDKQITKEDVLLLFPEFDGHISYNMAKEIVRRKKVEDLLIGYVSKKSQDLPGQFPGTETEELVLENYTDQSQKRWGILLWEEFDAIPVSIELLAHSEVTASLIGILKNNSDSEGSSKSSSSKSRKTVSFRYSEEEMIPDQKIYEAEYLSSWFKKRDIMPTKADGKCAAHALFGAFSDIGLALTLEDIINGLELYDKPGEEFSNEPEKVKRIVKSWWSIEAMMDYVETTGVGLRLQRVESDRISYWSTRYPTSKWIGIWCNGLHYQWTKERLTKGQNKWVSLSDNSTADKEDDDESKDKEKGTSTTMSVFHNKLHSAKNESEVDNIIGETFSNMKKATLINALNKFHTEPYSPAMKPSVELSGLRKELYESPYFSRYPKSLQDYICNSSYVDAVVEYSHPPISDRREFKTRCYLDPAEKFTTHIPYRLDLPIIPLPGCIIDFLRSKNRHLLANLHDHHAENALGFARLWSKVKEDYGIENKPLSTDINVLKLISRSEFGYRNKLVSEACAKSALKMTMNDMSVATGEYHEMSQHFIKPSETPSYLLLIQRIRIMLSLNRSPDINKNDEFIIDKNEDGSYIARSGNSGKKFLLFSAGNLFAFFHEDINDVFIGSNVYLDYSIAYIEVRHNLLLIRSSREYTWIRPLVDFLIMHSEKFVDHNLAVSFMKSYEAFCLNLSDIQDSEFVNWAPIIDTIEEMTRLSNSMSVDQVSLPYILFDLFNLPQENQFDNDLSKLINILKTYSGLQLQEVSSLHKFLYFAECDQLKGMNKYLKRVHTKRNVDPLAIEAMVRYAKREFTINYHKKHGLMPSMKEENASTRVVADYLRTKDYTQLRSYPLAFWDVIIPWNCLDNMTTSDPLEVAKDKGAVKQEVRYGPGDAQRELVQLISRNEYDFKPLDLEKFKERVPASVERISRLPGAIRDDTATRLNPKEKEQKIEARLYGVANLDNKHGLSILMNKAKKALSYFETQVMTAEDKERKIKLHDMSQEMQDPKTFAVLLDIEGHNQSMQSENCADLYEFVGNLFGEEGWKNLPNFFNNLTIYFHQEYEDDTHVSRGQLGGIEGWMNPLWTLHTSIMIDLLGPLCGMITNERSTYSDDVAFLLRLLILSQNHTDEVFTTVKNHCGRFGMTVKMLQTSVTKNRMTLLRQHYFKGERADSTLKRLLSVSSFSNGVIVSEELETAAITSSCSSALEMSEHVMTVTFIKWYKSVFTNSRLLSAIFDEIRHDNIIMSDSFPTEIRTLLWGAPGDLFSLIKEGSIHLTDIVKERAYQFIQSGGVISPELSLDDQLGQIFGYNTFELSKIKRSDMILYLLTENEFMQDFFWFFLTLPCTLGGKGVNLLMNDILSGHSEGMFKQLYYMKVFIDSHADKKNFFYLWMESALGHKLESADRIRPTSLCSATWAGSPDVKPIGDYLRNQISKYIKYKSRNQRINRLLALSNKRQEFLNALLTLSGDKVSTRIIQFYAENSVYHILDLLVKKVETSSGFINNLRGLSSIRSKIHTLELAGFKRSMTADNFSYGPINLRTDLLEYLTNRRASMFPKVNIVEVDEPLYDHLLYPSSGKRIMFSAVITPREHVKGGHIVYKRPVFGNEVLYKGEFTGEGGLFSCIEEYLMSKMASVTMWMTHKSGVGPTDHLLEDRNRLFALCDASLSTLSEFQYKDLVPYIPLTTGGEIFHRLPNMRFKTSSVIRAMPLTSPMFDVHINQHEVARRDLSDSNINFDYIRHRIMIAHTIRRKYITDKQPFTHYYLSSSSSIQDVSGFKLTSTTHEKYKFPSPYNGIVGRTPSFSRINQIAYNYLTSANPSLIDITIPTQSADYKQSATELIIEELAMNYYRDLQRNHMTISYYFDRISTWQPFISTLKKKYLIYTELKDGEAFEDIKRVLGAYRRKLIHIDLRHVQSLSQPLIDNHLLESVNEDLLSIDVYLGRISSLITKMTKGEESSKEQEHYDQLREDLVNIHEFRLAAARAFTFRILIQYCCQYGIDGSQVQLVRGVTDSNLKNTLAEARLVLGQNAQDLAFLDAICGTSDYTVLYEHAEGCYDLIDQYLLELDISESFTHGLKPDIQVSEIEESIETIPTIAKMCDYREVEIEDSFFRQADKVSRTLTFVRHTSALYGNPMIYWSPTGSDSFVAQYGLFSMLLSSGFLQNGVSLCDLTAGRGDGHVALELLDIPHRSFSRKDTFTASPLRKNVEFVSDYDVFNWNTMPWISLFGWIHIDISFTGKDGSDISDLVINLMTLRKRFSIRLNSVTWNESVVERVDLINSYNFFISYPVSEGLKPYQVYLIGIPTMPKLKAKEIQFKEEIWHKSLSQNYGMMISAANIFLSPTINISNSSTILFSLESDINELGRAMLEDQLTTSRIHTLSKVSRTRHLLNQIMVTPTLLPKKAQKYIRPDGDSQIRLYGKFYQDYDIKSVGGTKPDQIKRYQNHLTTLQEGHVESLHVELSEHNKDILDMIQFSHPIKEIRVALSDFLDCVHSNYISMDSDRIDVDQQLDLLKSESKSRFTSTTKKLRLSFLLLLYSVFVENYQYGLRMLWLRYHTPSYNVKETIALIEEYRKLSGLYPVLVEKANHDEKDRLLRLRIKSTIIDKHIYNYLKARKEKLHHAKSKAKSTTTEHAVSTIMDADMDWEAIYENFMMNFGNLEQVFMPTPEDIFSGNKEVIDVSEKIETDKLGDALMGDDLSLAFANFGKAIAGISDEKAAEYAAEEYGYAIDDTEGAWGEGGFGGEYDDGEGWIPDENEMEAW